MEILDLRNIVTKITKSKLYMRHDQICMRKDNSTCAKSENLGQYIYILNSLSHVGNSENIHPLSHNERRPEGKGKKKWSRNNIRRLECLKIIQNC